MAADLVEISQTLPGSTGAGGVERALLYRDFL